MTTIGYMFEHSVLNTPLIGPTALSTEAIGPPFQVGVFDILLTSHIRSFSGSRLIPDNVTLKERNKGRKQAKKKKFK